MQHPELVAAIRKTLDEHDISPGDLTRARFRELDPTSAWTAYANRGGNWGKAKAEVMGDALPLTAIPEGHVVKGISSYVDKEGKIKGQWVKTAALTESVEALVLHLTEHLPALVAPVPVTPGPDLREVGGDLLAVYPIGDMHMGMYANAAEAGADWDRAKALEVGKRAIENLATYGTPTDEALLINLGDFFHVTGPGNTTVKGTPQDVDGSFVELFQDGIDLLVYMIQRLLSKHDRVTVWNNVGNHDGIASVALSMILQAYFRDEPRVSIPVNPSAASYMRFGKCLIGSTHGDTYKEKDLPILMANDCADLWDKDQKRFWYVGHVHHRQEKEHTGAVVETFRTLAKSDSWHNKSGYRSGRDMHRIVLHRRCGEVDRRKFSPEMFE